ncbi:MlaD family protein [Mycobacteroides abscessus]|uniref:MlaD family protein n=1 Tax=Mycobacteroides abscessus TaxID=36809 RepID=UPI000928405E|nr:MCE family protein [Mycobacteroides abscessus]MDO3333934.1 MCE family protein [Mycobacteroides abscessus subsp. bolletii]QSM86857.1 MCE family protein [Mycobacteroides abscessus subsp. bolletii]SIB90404.1 Mce family protein Mce5B [Mycobacteroides abscessus subsp. bolletii]SKS87253.1 Mce family protein Mce5B [Mycobacteroides abscessus subsp. bolletii]SKT10702.1 Mce family protein Mce5B [Mycobacteroides abscessus subsp. bolletii]
MRYRRAAIALAVFLVVSAVATWLVLGTLRREVTGPANAYSAVFTDVSGLKVGDDVRIAGVRIGRVDRIDLVDDRAVVKFRADADQTLYDDTTAAVTYQNIIGQRYIGLNQGSAQHHQRLATGSQIPVERTRPSFDISGLLNGFEPLFALLDPQQVDNLTNGIIQALQGDSGSVLTLLTQTSSLAQTLAGPDAVLGEVITNLNAVTAVLVKQNTNLQDMIGQSRQILATLADRREHLVASAGSINTTVSRLAQITDAVYSDLQQLLLRNPGFLAVITGEGKDRFSMYAANLILIFKGLARATQRGAYVDGLLCDVNSTIFASLSRVIPGVVKLASPGNIVQHSPICSK